MTPILWDLYFQEVRVLNSLIPPQPVYPLSITTNAVMPLG